MAAATKGAEIANVYVSMRIKAPNIKRDIEREIGGVDATGAGSKIAKKFSAGMKKTLKVTGVAIAGVLGTALVKGFGRLKAIETAQAKMRGLGYDSKTVAKAMDNALASVKGTAFGLGDAATVAGGAMAAQIKPGKELETHLTRIANNAAAAGIGFDEMGSIFNKAATQANGVQNDIIGQLADKGIPIYAELGKQMGVTAGEVFKLASEGKVSFDVFSKAAEAAAGTVAAEMGNTTTGAFDNMMAALGRLGAKILEDVFPLIGPLFQEITAKLDDTATQIEPVVKWIGERLPTAIQTTKDFFTGLFSWLGANKDWLLPVTVGIGTAIVAVKTVSVATAAWKSTVVAFKAVQAAYTAYTYGMAGATYTYEGASKAGAIATKLFNAALKANPIGIIVTAVLALVSGLVWFFTQTETGKKVWAEFTRFLGEAWANITGFFTAAFENVIKPVFEGISAAVAAVGEFFVSTWETRIKPVFDGIAAVAKWVFETILIPIFKVFEFAFAVMAGIVVGLYETLIKPGLEAFGALMSWLYASVVKPVIDAIGAAFQWVYDSVIAPIVEGIKAYIGFWVTAMLWLWTSAIKPTIDAIGAAFKWIYESIIRPVVDTIVSYFKMLGSVFVALWRASIKVTNDAISNAFKWLWTSVIQPVWDGIKNTISNVWTNGIKPVIDTLVKVIQTDPKRAFEAARDAIGDAWRGIQDLAKKPVKFVVDTVINGLIGTINKIPGVNIPTVSLPKGFAGGGVLPGYMAAKRDDILMPMRSGEGVLVPEVVRGLGPGFIHALNAAGNNGGVNAVRERFGHIGAGLARGGMVHPLPGAVVTTSWMGYPGHTGIDLAKPQGTPIQAAAAGVVSRQQYHVNYGNMVDLSHGADISTRYAHMLGNVAVKLGQSVKAGQVVGYEGSTGNSTGPHLHWEVLKGGRAIDPTPYLTGAASVNPLFGIIDGLTDFATSTFKKAFPGGDMFIDAAGGIMSQGVKSIVKWATDLLSVGGAGITPMLYDNGGFLLPGLSLVNNETGRPEPIFTGSEFDRLVEGRSGRLGAGQRLRLVIRDREFDAFLEEVADDAVRREVGSQSRGSFRRDGGF